MASENFAGIDFDEIKEATALEVDEIKVLKLCFNLFDVKKQDFLGSDDLVRWNVCLSLLARPSQDVFLQPLIPWIEQGDSILLYDLCDGLSI